jgi:AcrR family transcriptional regulator
MAAAGLTHGGFYRHFESKDQLVAEACAAATESAMATFFSNKSSKNGLKGRVAQYLHPMARKWSRRSTMRSPPAMSKGFSQFQAELPSYLPWGEDWIGAL